VQADRHGHRLLVVQQQWRQAGAHAEPVAARDARRRVHRVTQVPQSADVPAHGTQADAEPVGQLGARPVTP
jgi:anti-sigma factor ChrR (cupin superfamily)